MRTLSLIMVLALYLPIEAQIIFEEITPIPGTVLFDIDESSTGFQSAVTQESLFGKPVTGSSWVLRNQNAASIYDLQHSPDGDLYTKNDSLILHSQNNGETFTVIDWPNGIFPPFNFTYLYVLDDDVLFIYDYGGHCFYTLDNGQLWHWAGQLLLSSEPVVRLVDNYIYVADPSFVGAGIVAQINSITGQVEIVDMNILAGQIEFIYSQITEDGAVYMLGKDYSGPQSEFLLLRYYFGQNIESLGPFPNPTNAWSFFTTGSALYNFGQSNAEVFNGIEFQPISYVGLPQDGERYFIHAENDHVFAIIDNTRIFRSVGTLTYPAILSGRVNQDKEQECIPDAGETGLAFWNVTVAGPNFFHSGISRTDGTFSYSVPNGEYTVSAQPPGTGWVLCEDDIQVVVDDNQSTANVDFLAKATDNCASLSLDFSTPLLRRCFENYYTVRVRNTGPQVSTGTTLVLQLDQFFEFQSASIPHNQIDATTISFDLGTLELNTDLVFRIFFTLSCQAELGMEHCLSGELIAENVCAGIQTSSIECQTNRGSFDPNDKRSFNEDGRESDRVEKDEFIYYHIRFQNTGTDTAFNVRIIDPLSAYLDLMTLEMLTSSHPYTYEITDGSFLIADFKNILLPDSTTNEAASHGFLKFRVKPFSSYDYGTSIPNKADIFFDFNDPILTNETNTVILPAVDVQNPQKQIDFSVFPNPAKHILELLIDETDHNLIESWKIYDSQGRTMLQALYQHDRSLDISSLAPGTYILSLMSKKKVIGTKTFVKG